MSQNENYKTGHTLTLLFTFLFGALLTLLYLPAIKLVLPEGENLAIISMLGILFSGALLASSLNGIVLLPLLSSVFGACAALEVDRIRSIVSSGAKAWPEITVLFVIVPLFFRMCTWGMYSSLVIRELMVGQEPEFRKNKITAYTIMLLGLTALAAALSMIQI